MKLRISIILLLGVLEALADLRGPTDKFFQAQEVARAEYRKDFSEELMKCDRVYIYLVDFDDIIASSDPFSGDEKRRIRIHPYGDKSTAILQEKELNEAQRKKMLTVLAGQIAMETQYGGAFCHFPIHAIKAYTGEQLILESTFCWVCGNFGFDYPDGAEWLDITKEMEIIFQKLLPTPESEIQRFREKYPSSVTTNKENNSIEDQPIQPPRD